MPTAVGTGALCAVLHPEVGQEPEVTLATNPTGAADPSGIDRGSHEVDVDPSGGAYVLSGAGEGADDGTRYVIDTKGSKYALVGSAVPGYIGTATSSRRRSGARGSGSSTPASRCRPTRRAGCRRTPRRRTTRPGRRVVTRARLRTALAAGVVAATVPAWASPARAAEETAPCSSEEIPGSEQLADTKAKDNPVFDRMRVEDAQRLATGRGAKVAVIDSGVRPLEGLAATELGPVAGASGAILSGHGTIVAGLVAGPRGVAPDAQVFSVKVYDKETADPTQGEKALTSGGVVAGIEAVLAADPPRGLRRRHHLARRRPGRPRPRGRGRPARRHRRRRGRRVRQPRAGGTAGRPRLRRHRGQRRLRVPGRLPGRARGQRRAAGGRRPVTYVLPNLDTDVAAPTVGAISYNATGQVCATTDVATSWAAAEVSGVLALLRERFPRETAAQLVARLEATTEGAGLTTDPDVRDPWTGSGVVQAYDALTRELRPGRQGKVETTRRALSPDAQAPPAPEPVDLFSTPRAMLLWSGLGAGSLLALAVMLRPLLRRR